jgi:hypothetical protein
VFEGIEEWKGGGLAGDGGRGDTLAWITKVEGREDGEGL